ncbi:hypothetical protein RI129_009193 [Pyrocoelia pectoralis]|uniref:RING-type domain-containing protein n=1 Tax=Pyrocoelia pectoralis TaxID=417401 RepID=A0AAN7ZLY2_9COLE
MIEVILQFFNLVKYVGYLCFALSFNVGQAIINGFTILFEVMKRITASIQTVTKILTEDFYIFWKDISQLLQYIFNFIDTILNSVYFIYDAIKTVLWKIIFSIVVVYDNIFIVLGKSLQLIMTIFITLKQWILLIGSGIWFAITLIPLFIVHLCTITTYYVCLLSDEILNVVDNSRTILHYGYDFITDVPIDSLAGLVSGFCILLLLIKLQAVIYQKLQSFLQMIRRTFSRFQLLVVQNVQYRNMYQRPPPSSESSTSNSDGETDLEPNRNLCLICQDNSRCMLFLPCRHLCLCEHCNLRILNYNYSCPLCRSEVEETMRVYV